MSHLNIIYEAMKCDHREIIYILLHKHNKTLRKVVLFCLVMLFQIFVPCHFGMDWEVGRIPAQIILDSVTYT